MRNVKTIVLASVAVATVFVGNASAQDPQIDSWGFSIPPDLPQVGETLELVTVVNSSTTQIPLPLDFGSNEYTMHIENLVLEEIIPNGPLIEMHYSSGVVAVYEDPSFNAPFQATTPHDQIPDRDESQVPSSFRDGEMILEFAFDAFITLWFDAAGLGSVAFGATELTVIGGTGRQVLEDEEMESGWHLGGGFTNDVQAQIPDGYAMRYDILLRFPDATPVEPASWGRIKSSFVETR